MRIVTLAPLFLVVGCSSAAVPWSSSDDAGDDIRTPTSDASLAADANVRSDAGAKPSNDGGGSVIDAGGWDLDAGYTPWTVVCGISTCDRQQNRMCCIDTQSGIKTCRPISCNGVTEYAYECDGPEDCPNGKVCCVDLLAFAPARPSACRPAPLNSEVIACHTNADCPNAQPHCCVYISRTSCSATSC